MSFIGPARPPPKEEEVDNNINNTTTTDKKRSASTIDIENDNNLIQSPQPPPKRIVIGPRLDDGDDSDVNKEKEILSPQPPPPNRRIMGPRLDDDKDEISSNNIGPQLTTKTTTNRRVIGPRLDDSDKRKVVVGPVIGPSRFSSNDDDSSSDEEANNELDTKSEWDRVRNSIENNNNKVPTKREEWMTTMPTGRIESMTNRQFSQKGNATAIPTGSVSNLVGDTTINNINQNDESKQYFEKLRQLETEEKMKSFNDKNRSESLLSIHQQKQKQTSSSSSSSNNSKQSSFSFNRDEDLQIGKVDKEHLNNIVKGSVDLNSKFGKSNWM